MSFLSATVPVITEEDEIKEFKSLTEQEQALVEADVFGLSYDKATKDGRGDIALDSEEAWRQLVDEIKNSLNNSELKQALQCCPELVMTESDPAQFLRCENLDKTLAAQRLMRYWAVRVSLFGEDRAFLPMTLEGAMQEDRVLLETSAIVMALEDDGAGRSVLYWDRVRVAEVDRCAALRCLFYTASVMIRKKTTCEEGGVALTNYNGCSDIRKHYDRFVTRNVVAITACLPVHVCGFHFYTGVSRRNVAALLLPVMKQMMGRKARLRIQVHCGCNLEGSFARYKLSKSHADAMTGPPEARLAIAQKWIHEQIELEREMVIPKRSPMSL